MQRLSTKQYMKKDNDETVVLFLFGVRQLQLLHSIYCADILQER